MAQTLRRVGATTFAAVLLAVGGTANPAQAFPEGFTIETIGYYGYGVVGSQAQVIQVATAFVSYPEQTISFDLSGLPQGATWHFDPAQVDVGGSTWAYVTTPPGTPSGFYPFTVYGYGDSTQTTQFMFVLP